MNRLDLVEMEYSYLLVSELTDKKQAFQTHLDNRWDLQLSYETKRSRVLQSEEEEAPTTNTLKGYSIQNTTTLRPQ
jgi:hypothetical protein